MPTGVESSWERLGAWGHAAAAALAAAEDETEPVDLSGLSRDAGLAALARHRPALFPDGARGEQHLALIERVGGALIAGARQLGRIDDQGGYQRAWQSYAEALDRVESELTDRRFMLGNQPDQIVFADYLLFAFAIRIDLVYYDLYKANPGLLADYPVLYAYARDLYERPEIFTTTDFDAIRRHAYAGEPVLNDKGVVPVGGGPVLHRPHFRAADFTDAEIDQGTEEDPDEARLEGEWVRPQSRHRRWISEDADARHPAEAGRYHIYAPYNCPWSHRALLVRAVKGLEEVVGATVLYFRRDPARGWQVNPAIPACTDDPVHGIAYLDELYQRVGSEERSAPVLWDGVRDELVSNESAEILRMLNQAFGTLATRADLDLYPEEHRAEIDRLNEMIYQRINNGAYKAGFTSSQQAYERAFWRYFAALDWLDELLQERDFLVGTPHLTEADLRLFPTVFRHDAVYFTRFKLGHRRIRDYANLQAWLDRMMEVPGVAAASNLDHARNGYFGRTGNEIVPAGPVPLGLSRADFSDDVWLNRKR